MVNGLHTIPSFDHPDREGVINVMDKGEKAGNQHVRVCFLCYQK